ncbi:hypothetical protein ACROYT_G026444 [Oculina patagonica]
MTVPHWLSVFLVGFTFLVLRSNCQGVCPSNWIHAQGSCYKFFSKALNWNAAKSACEALGSNLVVINSQTELQALTSKIPDALHTWIGFHRNPKDKSRWLWVDQSPVTYTHWYKGEPNSLSEECAEMYANRYGRKWNDAGCSATFSYVCETKECPNGWINMQGSCYKFFSKALNWNAAKSACEAHGSKLVMINSQVELQALTSKIPDSHTWIGLYRNPKDKSRWLWVDGTPVTYTHWAKGEPNGLHEECGEMRSKSHRWEWNDLGCSATFPYVCETRANTCQKLTLKGGVSVSPSSCLSSKQMYGSTCSFTCARGYQLSGPSSTQCGRGGAWSGQVSTVSCKVIKCPVLTVGRLVKTSPNNCVTSQMTTTRNARSHAHKDTSYKVPLISSVAQMASGRTVLSQSHALVGFNAYIVIMTMLILTSVLCQMAAAGSHKCVNTVGGYKCGCPDPELSLSLNNKTCHGNYRLNYGDTIECTVSASSAPKVMILKNIDLHLHLQHYGFVCFFNDKTVNRFCIILAPGVGVQCNNENMTIIIPKSLLRGIDREHLRLLDTTCKAKETSSHFFLTTSLTGCNTTRRHTPTAIVYSNAVLEIPVAAEDVVTRVREIEIQFSCFYSKYGVVSSVGWKPSNRKLLFSDEGKGNFTLSLNMFPDKRFVSPYTKDDFPVAVVLRKLLFFEVSVTSGDKQLSIIADRCYATPTQDQTNSLKYEFIKKGCPKDVTVKYHSAPSVSAQRFSLETFKFIADHPFVFVHCHVTVCNATDPDSQCAKKCPSSGRGRRAVSDHVTDVYFLAQGPLHLARGKRDEKRENVLDKSGSSPAFTISLFVMCIACLAGTVLIIFKKSRGKPAGYAVLVSGDQE